MESTSNGSTLRAAGGTLLALGLLLALAGFAMTTTAEYSDTLNIGLLNDQTNRILAGGFSAVCGAVLFAAGAIIPVIGKLLPTTETENTQCDS
ncbi:hypothetical protein [Sphingorhabdus sp.]|uniref:hypothetical protein n=1 Tax=Sphingorhabdus sp. TaxID=1902408 RepID=UPI0035B37EB4